MKFEIYKTEAGRLRWRLVEKGKVLAISAETFWNEGEARSACYLMRNAAASTVPVISVIPKPDR